MDKLWLKKNYIEVLMVITYIYLIGPVVDSTMYGRQVKERHTPKL
jgi:hypothetical protein